MAEQKKSKWFAESSLEDRLIFLGIFIGIASAFLIFYLYKEGDLRLGPLATQNSCTFYRNFGIPCPTCYWTRAFDSFVKFGTTEALVVQPGATVCYIILILVGFFSLLSSILGVNFVFLPSVRLWRIDYIAIFATIIVLAGWIITIIKIKYQN
ncbi:MAG: hypothetical protein A2Y12_11275 [Planctomycetes bacterium GWF2_42_9]|nr:MAG: hypothetical protein A2Y12_11275 [Planctomycetes bacterium GWF2_42_9]HAL45142.1 hypothetical protein [Phycisphaerales bacterium]